MNLIEGAKWSDGEPFTADDVMFTWEGYIVDPNVNSPCAWMPGVGRRCHHVGEGG
jgi:ABC-type transport system substrate-binding protein